MRDLEPREQHWQLTRFEEKGRISGPIPQISLVDREGLEEQPSARSEQLLEHPRARAVQVAAHDERAASAGRERRRRGGFEVGTHGLDRQRLRARGGAELEQQLWIAVEAVGVVVGRLDGANPVEVAGALVAAGQEVRVATLPVQVSLSRGELVLAVSWG